MPVPVKNTESHPKDICNSGSNIYSALLRKGQHDGSDLSIFNPPYLNGTCNAFLLPLMSLNRAVRQRSSLEQQFWSSQSSFSLLDSQARRLPILSLCAFCLSFSLYLFSLVDIGTCCWHKYNLTVHVTQSLTLGLTDVHSQPDWSHYPSLCSLLSSSSPIENTHPEIQF